MLTADLAAALIQRSIIVTWMAATPSASDSLPTLTNSSSAPPISRLRVPMPVVPAPPVDWQNREKTAAATIITALRELPPIDLIHLTHFSSSGLDFLDQPLVRDAPVVATLTDYTAVCGNFHFVHRTTGQRCTPPIAAEMCATCLTARSACQVSQQDIETWRRRNLAILNERCGALWMQTPHQRRQMTAAGLRDDHIVSDRAAYAIPPAWHSRRPVNSSPTLLFLGRASAEKGLHVLLEAFVAWRRIARLVVCSSPDDADYESWARPVASADPRIEWRDPVARDDLVGLLNDADALVVPSQWDENHPMVLQYALALSVPVLCSRVASLEHLSDRNGLYFIDRYWEARAWIEAFEDLILRPQNCAIDRSVEMRLVYDEHVDTTLGYYHRLVGVA